MCVMVSRQARVLLFKVDHIFLFETVAGDETKTRFVHYEYAGGMSRVVTKGMTKKMPQACGKFNTDFKKFGGITVIVHLVKVTRCDNDRGSSPKNGNIQ